MPTYTTADLIDAITALGRPQFRIGPYQFTANPFTFHLTEQQIFQDYPAYNGILRFDYGQRAREYQITGFYENGGVVEFTKSRKIMPGIGRGEGTVYTLVYPFMGITQAQVYIDTYEASVDPSLPHYIQYTIVAHEYASVPQVVPLVASTSGLLQATSAEAPTGRSIAAW